MTEILHEKVEASPSKIFDTSALLGKPPNREAKPSKNYLETGVDAVTSCFIKDEKSRDTVDHFAGSFIKTAALFTGGKAGLIGTAAIYGLSKACPDKAVGEQFTDFAFGAAEGTAMKGVFKLAGTNFEYAATKGMFIGTGSRAVDILCRKEVFTNPTETSQRLRNELLNPQSLILDATIWTLGEGACGLANATTKGALARSQMGGSAVMGYTFGSVSGGISEIGRQRAEHEKFDFGKVAQKSLSEGIVNSAAAMAGTHFSPATRITELNKTAEKQELEHRLDSPTSREFVVTSGLNQLNAFRNSDSASAMLKVREFLTAPDGSQHKGPARRLFVQRLGETEVALMPQSQKADLIACCYPENLSQPERSKHLFEFSDGKIALTTGGDNVIRFSTRDFGALDLTKGNYDHVTHLDPGESKHETTLNVMAPLLIGDPANPHSEHSTAEWKDFRRQLYEAKQLGAGAVSTDVWWGIVEPSKGKFDWSHYDRVSDEIARAGLKWVPILSFHQCGGNVGDNVNIPLPNWIWKDIATRLPDGNPDSAKFKSEQGHTSSEYVSIWADHAVLENYEAVMRSFQRHFEPKAANIEEVNISLGPAGELRYPSYNSHDQGVGFPERGALQAYSDIAIKSFRDYTMNKYGDMERIREAWGSRDISEIFPPGNPQEFFNRNDHHHSQYGRDFFDWYNQSLIDHGRRVMNKALDVFASDDSPMLGIDIGAKVPGVHWRLGEINEGKILYGDRLSELSAGLIRTSLGDWHSDDLGRGYRPIISMLRDLQPILGKSPSRIVPVFTCLEMPDGQDGPSARALPHTLVQWFGNEANRQGLVLKGENALNGNLYNQTAWDLMRSELALPQQRGNYHGLTFLRMSDVVNNDVARAKMSELAYPRDLVCVSVDPTPAFRLSRHLEARFVSV
ncbi:MAG: family 14 glycosylhydrolase [Candidatus Melainabacteria bacterium]|nr:family 14 glycosylhydrolase [Candidatus Melainabacteria bacterium]